jgi:hypothetical protein
MRIRAITFTARILVILASALIISCSSAPEAPPVPTKDSTAPQASKTNTPRIENPKDYIGKDVNSYAQKVNHKQQNNAVSCPACDLVNADLGRANLGAADLTRANLTQANLEGANLSGADLASASLTRANLKGANLAVADLRSTDPAGRSWHVYQRIADYPDKWANGHHVMLA